MGIILGLYAVVVLATMFVRNFLLNNRDYIQSFVWTILFLAVPVGAIFSTVCITLNLHKFINTDQTFIVIAIAGYITYNLYITVKHTMFKVEPVA